MQPLKKNSDYEEPSTAPGASQDAGAREDCFDEWRKEPDPPRSSGSAIKVEEKKRNK